MNKKNKRNVKIIALVVAAVFALGIVGIALTQSQIGHAAPQASGIGYVDVGRAIQSHPNTANAQSELQREFETLQREFEERARNMNDRERHQYSMQLQQRLQQKEATLFGAIQTNIEEVVRRVATARGLTIVVTSDIVIFGGTDITDDVIRGFSR